MDGGLFMRSLERPGLFDPWVDRPYSPFGGLDPTGGSLLGGVAFNSAAQYLFGSRGFLPGPFAPTGNLFDQMQAAAYQRDRAAAVAAGFRADAPEAARTIRGLAGAFGIELGPDATRSVAAMVEQAAPALPFLAPMAPMAVDALFGYRGSRGLAADEVYRRGRHEVDPVTGRLGLSAESTSARVEGLYRNLYEGGDRGRGLAEMRGMGVGTAAAIASEIGRYGLGGRALGSMSAEERAGLLGGREAPEAVREFDAARTAEGVKKVAGAISAVRDLFGEHGRPDAPIPTLFKALNDLTQGGLQLQNPQQLEMSVRTAQSLMRAGGMGLDAYASLVAKAGSAATTFGLDQSQGASIALGSAAASIAFGEAGLGAARGPGALSREQYVARDVELRAAAAASGQANDLAALIRFEEMGGRLDPEQRERLDAARAGRATYGPDGRAVRYRRGEAARIISASEGGGAAVASDLLRSRELNRDVIAREGLGSTVRKLQADEAQEAAGEAFFQSLRRAGVGEAEARKAAGGMAGALFGMSMEDASDPGRRREALAAAAGREGVGREAALRGAEGGLGGYAEAAKSLWNLDWRASLQLFNRGALDLAGRRESEARQEAEMGRALSALGRHGPLARLAEIVRDPGGKGLVDSIAEFLGGVPVDDVRAAVGRDAAGSTPGQRLAVVAAAARASVEEFDAARDAGGEAGAARAAAATREVEALVGGDAARAAAEAEAFRKGRGLSGAQMAALGRGEAVEGVDPSAAARARGLMFVAGGGGNLAGAAEAAGAAGRSRVTREEAESAAARLAGYGRGAGAGPASRRLAGKAGAAALEDADRIAAEALGDESGATAAALGAGRAPGTADAVAGVREAAARARALAAESGSTVEELLASDAKDGPAAEARRLVEGAARHAAALAKGARGPAEDYAAMAADDPRRKAFDAEAAKLAELRGKAADPKKAAEEQIDAILRQTGTSVGRAERADLAGKVAAAPDPGAVLAGLRGSLAAEGRLHAPGGAGGDAEAQARAAGALGGLRAGGAPVGPARAAEAIGAVIESLSGKGGGAGADPGRREPLQVSFAPNARVRLDGDELTFAGGIEIAGDLGSAVA